MIRKSIRFGMIREWVEAGLRAAVEVITPKKASSTRDANPYKRQDNVGVVQNAQDIQKTLVSLITNTAVNTIEHRTGGLVVRYEYDTEDCMWKAEMYMQIDPDIVW